ncbi:MAG: DUF4364 family protein [Lachnospiraceae bacterium]|nr:DUF4364 family protein [Lachnospiraceae bacterium]
MSSTGLTLYKLMILYMLEKVNFPLTNNQITGFILDQGYTDYFHVQQAISELVESNLITTETIRNASYLKTTEEGARTLSYFKNDISNQIREDIDHFLKENAFELRNEVSTLSDYDRTPEGDYCVRCRVREGNSILIELNFTVPTEEEAKAVCRHWPEKSQKLYMHILETLL